MSRDRGGEVDPCVEGTEFETGIDNDFALFNFTKEHMATFRSRLFSREWPRPSVRNLLILVAAIGVCLGGIVEIRARRERFILLAYDHSWKSGEVMWSITGTVARW